jgi:hypothetical protein
MPAAKEEFMRKLWIPLTLLGLAVCFSPKTAADAEGHVNFFLGQKSLDSDDWDPVDKQPEFGAVMSFGGADWPVLIAADVLTSADEEDIFDSFFGSATLKAATFEAAFGARKIWDVGNTHPYVGGGIALVGAGVEYDTGVFDVDADDSAIGPWIGGGVFWRLGSRFNLGFDARWSDAEVDLDFGLDVVAQDVSAGGFHGGVTVGFGW